MKTLAFGALCILGGAIGMCDEPLETMTVFEDEAWSWFQDERAIVHQNQLFAGSVSSAGDIQVAQVDLRTGAKRNAILHPRLNKDDHAAPALLIRDDGRIMVFYAAHHGPHFFRVSRKPLDISQWGEERRTGTEGSYMNPYQLAGEDGRIYFFFRSSMRTGWDPAFTSSDDGGGAWSPWRKVLDQLGHSYIKVVSDGDSRLHFGITQGHPRDHVTGVYHAYYENGGLHTTNGTRIAALGDATHFSKTTRVFDGAGLGGKAWIWDIALDSQGNPRVVFAVFPTVEDHRYHYARWDGTRWLDYEVAKGGRYLYRREKNYSGGVTLDPENPNVIYISTNQKVGDIENTSGKREIIKGVTSDGGGAWKWTPITSGSTEENLRPIVPRHHRSKTMVLWERGRYTTFTDYNMKVLCARSSPAGSGSGVSRRHP